MQKLFNSIYFAPEAEGANAGGDKVETPADPGTVLFPNDKPADPPKDGDADDKKAGDPPAGDKDDKKPEGDKPADWKEYVNDPKKTDAENAAAKAEHDKTKPADKKDGDDKAKDPANQVPADGKYDLKMPDGVEVDQELLDTLGPQFKEIGLTNGQAQKLSDAYVKTLQDRASKQAEGWAKTIGKWADDAKADKDIGGDNWDGTVASATRAVNKLGTPALKEFLNASGGGNHPELIRFMSKVGAMIREDNPASGGAGGDGKPAEPAHVLFPSDAPKG
jgi:hypothetical protein